MESYLFAFALLLLAAASALLVRHAWVMEKNFMSYVDFSDEKFSQIEARLDKLEYFEAAVQEIMDVDLQKVLKLHALRLDTLDLNFENHQLQYYHLDGTDFTPVKSKSTIEAGFNLAVLESEILKRSAELGLINLKSARPEGK